MGRTTGVLVIGGGATGVGTARDLAMRGVDVTLVERGRLASGTSGRSHGLLHSGARYAVSDPAGAKECLEESRTLREIAPHCIDDTGGLFLQLAGDDPDYFDEKLAACRDYGMDVDVLDADAVHEIVPDVSADVERAMRVPDGVVSPSRLLAANAASAREHGATILSDAPVTDIYVEDDRVTGASVGGAVEERIDAKCVVNATGPWAEQCAALAGVDVPMRPTKGVMVAVEYEPLGPVLNRCRPPADGDIVVPRGPHAVLGTTSVVVEDPDDYPDTEQEIQRVIDECAAMMPALAERPVAETYSGVRPLYDPAEAALGAERGISRDFVLLDHAADGAAGFVSIVGGKLTTYRQMAESVSDHVCEFLGVDEPCRTADERLPGDSPAAVDRQVASFGIETPADGHVIGFRE